MLVSPAAWKLCEQCKAAVMATQTLEMYTTDYTEVAYFFWEQVPGELKKLKPFLCWQNYRCQS